MPNDPPLPILLIAEDNRVIREILGEFLAGTFLVRLASNKAGALRALQDQPPDIIITDLDLGDGTGFEVAEAARARNPVVRLYLMTARSRSECINRASELGFAAIIEKPVSVTSILSQIT